jgi:uncharacterized protein (DUF305 family)
MPSSRRPRWILGILAVVALIGIGYVAGIVTPSFGTPGNDSAEAGFARDMSTHHSQAVAMAMLEVQNGSDPEIRSLAGDIALTQQGQIGIMSQWLKDWNLLPTGDQPKMAWMPGPKVTLTNGLMPGMATVDEMNALSKAQGKDADILFCQLMLRHHVGGIHMVEGILQLTKNSEVHDLAEGMLNGQQTEIVVLGDDLTRLGAKPLSS